LVVAEEKLMTRYPTDADTLDIDLHGYRPNDLYDGLMRKVIEQAWETGAKRVRLIHGHGRNRRISAGFVNTNTGYLGLTVRSSIRADEALRRWIYPSTIDRSHEGSTSSS
jgi:hypothetical protein